MLAPPKSASTIVTFLPIFARRIPRQRVMKLLPVPPLPPPIDHIFGITGNFDSSTGSIVLPATAFSSICVVIEFSQFDVV